MLLARGTWLRVICWLATIFAVALMPLADVSPPAQAAGLAQLQEGAVAGAGSSHALGDTGDISITLEAGRYEIKQLGQYSVVEMEDFGSILTSGEPKLPSRVFLIDLPPGAEAVSVEMMALNYEEIPGEYRITPAPPIASGHENEKVKWEENKEIYSGESAYPLSPYEYLGMGEMRKHSFARVRFSPVVYYPAGGKLGLYQSITLRIKYEIVQVVSAELLADTVMDDVASQIIVNYASIKSQYHAVIAPSLISYNYVIITTGALQSSVEPLVTWKESIGYSVNVVTTSWISSTYSGADLPEKIRNFLIDKHIEWGIEYVLIVGSHSTIPMRYCCPDPFSHASSSTPTDYYYADLTGDWDSDGDGYFGEYGQDNVDFYPEVYVGRIPVDDGGMVESICQKSASFEQDSGAWKKKALLLGAISNYANEGYSPWPKTDGAALMEECWNDILWGNGYSRETMYEKAGLAGSTYPCNHPLTGSNVLNSSYGWPAGYGIVNWDAHGTQTRADRKVWAVDDDDGIPESDEMETPSFISSSDASSLDDSKPAIVFSSSCLNGYPENPGNLGKSLLERGAVAIVASTRTSWYRVGWEHKDDGANNSIDYYFFHYLINEGQKCGDALYNSQVYNKDYLSWSGPYDGWKFWQNMFDFCLYGEPSLGTASIKYDLRIESDGCCTINVGELGTTEPGATEEFSDIPFGTEVELLAVAGDCCEFVGWNVDDSPVEGNPIIVTMDDDHTAVATCSVPGYDLTVVADPVEGGEVTGSGTYDCCTYQAITATAADEWHFAGWTGDGITSPASANTTVHIDDDKTVTAQFTQVIEIELIEGVNIIHYSGATCDLPAALTNIGPGGLDYVEIVWARGAWTATIPGNVSGWVFYDVGYPPGSTLPELEYYRAYIIVMSEGCTWELPS